MGRRGRRRKQLPDGFKETVIGQSNTRHKIAVCVELALEETMNLSSDRLLVHDKLVCFLAKLKYVNTSTVPCM
jgi:hypothetical protein